MNAHISVKFFLGYLLIVLVPTLSIDYVLYYENYRSMIQIHLSNEQTSLNATTQNLAIRMNETISLTKTLEGSSSFCNYLSGYHSNLSEALYDYIKNIRPLFDNFSARNSILDFNVYTFRKNVLTINEFFTPVEELSDNKEIIEKIQHNVNGIWRFEKDEYGMDQLIYYRPFFNVGYTSLLGIIRVETDSEQYFQNLFPLSGQEDSYFIEETETGRIYQYHETVPALRRQPHAPSTKKGYYVQTADLTDYGFRFLHQMNTTHTFHYNVAALFLILFAILCLLTALYFFMTRSITRRIFSLTKHISLSDVTSLQRYENETYHDEVGTLMVTFNEMIDRINYLIHENLRAELSKKDAEYYALQAQIKPHFLYNILENIRMNAEINHAPQTADMLLSLGKFMRYNLNANMNAIPLTEELEAARNYFSILEIRMEDQLKYDIAALTEIYDVLCPRFVLQPLLENCVKHGIRADAPLHVNISIMDNPADENSVIVRIEDNGIGIEPTQMERLNQDLQNNVTDGNSHVGLRNVNNRLIAYTGQKGRLIVTASPFGGFTLSFLLNHTKKPNR